VLLPWEKNVAYQYPSRKETKTKVGKEIYMEMGNGEGFIKYFENIVWAIF
jgi:hypothetical protein